MRAFIVSVLLSFILSSAACAEAIKHILVFGDSNSWGWTPEPTAFPTLRLDADKRWPNVMAKALGDSFAVAVDALSGRTVDVDYAKPLGTVPGAALNGETALAAAIARELPLDLVIIMLGTNDVRSDLHRTPAHIAAGLARLAALVRVSAGGVFTAYPAPQVLLVVPPKVEDTSHTPIGAIMAGASEKSALLAAALRSALANTDIPMFDASTAVAVHGIDGVHMTEADHAAFGLAMANQVRQSFFPAAGQP